MKTRLKELRNTLHLKLREFAEVLDVTTGLVGHWERGSQDIPKVRIEQICTKFNVNRKWFETGEGEMFLPKPEPMDAKKLQRELLVKLFRELSEDSRQLVLDALRDAVGTKYQ